MTSYHIEALFTLQVCERVLRPIGKRKERQQMPNIEAFDLSPSFSLSFLAWRVKFLSVKYNFEFQGKIYCKNGNFGNI